MIVAKGETPPGEDLRDFPGQNMVELSVRTVCRDESQLGDIVSVKKHPAKWGRDVSKNYIIVIAKNLSFEDAKRLCQPLYPDGVTKADLDKGDKAKSLMYSRLRKFLSDNPGASKKDLQKNFGQEVTILKEVVKRKKPISMARFKFRIDAIERGYYNINTEKAKDPELKYQPLKGEKVIIDFAEPVALIEDKKTGTTKFSTFKDME